MEAPARTSRSPWAATAPSAPALATTTPARSASARTASSSSGTSAMWVASVAFGRKTSMWPSRSRRPPSHRSAGSQLGSTEVVAPWARTRSNSAGSSGARRSCRKYELTCTCRARSRRAGSISSVRRSAIVPAWVRIARSFGRARTTVTPVGLASSTTSPPTSTPRRSSSSRRKRPKWSSPTTPQNPTRSPSRAAPAATIAPEPPTVSRAPSTSRSACPNAGSTAPVSTRSGFASPSTRRSNGSDTPGRYRRSPPRSPRGCPTTMPRTRGRGGMAADGR